MKAATAPRHRLARMHGTRRYRRLALLPMPAGTRSRPCRGRSGELLPDTAVAVARRRCYPAPGVRAG